mgnify:CR=1 FL=1
MEEKNKQRGGQSFIYGATIMVVSTAIVKVLGALFRIPLAALIKPTGMGFYSTAYDLYLPIYALAMAGLPIAVSRITAEYVQKNRYNDVRKTLKMAKRAFLVTGFSGFFLMLAISYPFVVITGNGGALLGIFMIAPSVLFCCIMSSYRGYYEGLRNMYPTAISTIIEGLGKLILGYGLSYLVIKIYGGVTEQSASVAAAAALLGITLGTALGALFLVFRHKKPGDGITAEMLASSPSAEEGKIIIKNLVAIGIPVVLGSLVTNIASLIDVTMVQRQLSSAVHAAPDVFNNMYGRFLASEDVALSGIPNYLYGVYKGYAFTLYNLVPTITSVIGVSALPVLAMAWTKHNNDEIRTNIESMVRVTSLVAMPCGIGLIALAYPILNLLYHGEASIEISAKILQILGFTAVFSGIMSPLNNMLQAIGKQWVPIRNIAVGALLKIVINYLLVGIPQINIIGAPIGTLCCYIYIASANLICLVKYSGVKPKISRSLMRPFLAALCCGAAAYGVNALLSKVISTRISVLVAIFAAVLAYIAALFIFKAFTKEDLMALPKGDKLVAFCEKIHFFK